MYIKKWSVIRNSDISIKAMKNILVTGGAGFIGSHLCEKLVDNNNVVVCIDNLLTGSKKNIEHLLDERNFFFVKEDLLNIFTNYELPITNYQTIFHLASLASPNASSPFSYLKYPIETLLVNSVGTKNMLELARRDKARFIFASSSEVYGDPQVHPQTEDYWGYVNPTGPRSCYDEGKRFGEALTMAYYRKFGLDTRIVRIFNTYGPRMLALDGRVISNFIVQAIQNKELTVYGNGSQSRSFCYITDLVEGLVRIGDKDGIGGEVINLGNPDERKIRDVALLIKRITRSKAKIVYTNLPEDDPSQRCPDIAKATNLLSWLPEVNLIEGLIKTIAYFRKNDN